MLELTQENNVREFMKPSMIEFKRNPQDYSFRYVEKLSQGSIHKDITCGVSTSGIILRCKGLDSAIIGFDQTKDSLECLQIQGGERRLSQLTPIYWQRALLSRTLIFAKEQEKKYVTVVGSFSVDGWTPLNSEKLKKTYDHSAQSFGFEFSQEENKYIKKI